MPGTALAELALHLGAFTDTPGLAVLVVTAPLAIPPHGAVELRVLAEEPDDAGRRAVTVHSRPRHGAAGERAEWTRHARPPPPAPPPPPPPPPPPRPRGPPPAPRRERADPPSRSGKNPVSCGFTAPTRRSQPRGNLLCTVGNVVATRGRHPFT
ncbi:hypothetical protein [Nocardia cyriacigeorgica]|uniref:hypothetical protein n=1 Tax=Nocardia cyriacigeorgica TaxID=135487 RepID=UPI003CC7DF41